MTLVAGIDPGASGAIAIYNKASGELFEIIDMPTFKVRVNKKARGRIDPVGVAEIFNKLSLLGVSMVVIEEVGVRPREGAVGAFEFGKGFGMLLIAAVYSGIPYELVTPSTWKAIMRVRGKMKAEDGDIVARADELFPDWRSQWRGPRGGFKVDRAEAAMLAKFAADQSLDKLQRALCAATVEARQ